MRAVISFVLLVSGSYAIAAQPAPSFDVHSILNTARDRASQNLLPPLKGADQGVYEHVFKAYPKETGDCPESAKKIAANFAAATGAETLGAVCLEDTKRGFTIAVQYRGEARLNVVSTAQRASIFPSAGWKSKQECNAALEEEVARFERNTGLTSVVSYCFQSEFARRDEWEMRVEGFGNAQVAPHLSGAYVFGKVLGHSKSSFLGAIKEGMQRKGLDVSFVRFRSSMAYSEIGALYYAPTRLRFENIEYAKLANAEQCQAQLGLARAALGDAQELISYCGAMSITGNYEVSYLYAGAARETTSHYKKFDSYEACMAEREPTLEHFRGQGRSVVGALCGRTDKTWKIVFLNGK